MTNVRPCQEKRRVSNSCSFPHNFLPSGENQSSSPDWNVRSYRRVRVPVDIVQKIYFAFKTKGEEQEQRKGPGMVSGEDVIIQGRMLAEASHQSLTAKLVRLRINKRCHLFTTPLLIFLPRPSFTQPSPFP
jgi:hypothetical protein